MTLPPTWPTNTRTWTWGSQVRTPQNAWTWPPQRAVSPATILGSLYHSDFDAADPGIVLNAGNVASIPNRGLDASPLVQAVAANQPAFSATSFAGGPGITGDGVSDTLLCAFNVPIPAGARPYIWVVCKANNLAVVNGIVACVFGTPGVAPYIVTWTNRTDGNAGGGLDMNSGGGAGTGVAPNDLLTKLQEGAPRAGGVSAFVRNNVAFNVPAGTCTTLGTQLNRIRALAFSEPASQFATGTLRRIILASNMPSATQITAMRAYLRAQPYGLTF